MIGAMTYNTTPTEILAAAPDAVAIAAGASLERPHPLAQTLTLAQIATVCAVQAAPRRAIETDQSVVARGMGTGDFARVLAQGVAALAVQTYDGQAEHAAFAVPVEVKNFHPVTVAAVEAQGIELELLGQNAEISRSGAFLAAAGTAPVQLTTFAKIIGISRQAVVNDDLGAFATAVAGLGGSAARLEAQLIAAALEANPLLDDGSPVFDASHGNVVAAALDGPALGGAMALLRNQRTAAGQLAGLRARHIVVAPDNEFVARVLVKDSGLDSAVTVSVLPNLPAGSWYLLADPKTSPVIGLLRLAGQKKPVRVEQKKRGNLSDSTFVAVVCDTGAAILRRTGIVRGGA